MQQKAETLISEAEYLEMEEISEIKHEYYQGEIFAMAGASRDHNLIVTNLIFTLESQLRKRPCRTYSSDMRLQIKATGLYTYPDVMVICGEEKFLDEKRNTLLNPDVTIEVLSDSTEAYDRGEKSRHYRSIPSLKEYVLISQHFRRIEKYSRIPDQKWLLTESDKADVVILLESIGCELSIPEVYNKIDEN